jgi:3-dehydroquinate synthase
MKRDESGGIAIPVDLKGIAASYSVKVRSGSLSSTGHAVLAAVPSAKRVIVISNRKVFDLYGAEVERSLAKAGLAAGAHLIGDGERFKTLRTAEGILKAFDETGITRTDAVVSLGGGIVGDVAGFAAAIHLRGIAFFQIPTTLVAMIDASVGGKTGVNTRIGKNRIGAFHQPAGVLADPATLKTLHRREIVAGLCEAVKQAAVSGPKLLRETDGVLKRGFGAFFENDGTSDVEAFIAGQIAFKARIVKADERERVDATSGKSRKILNFGHTFGHALEKATNYRRFRHGEAVGHGVRFAIELSKRLEFLSQNEVNLLNDVIRRVGALPTVDGIEPSEVVKALAADKKKLGDSIQWILLKGIGEPVIIPQTQIPEGMVVQAIKDYLRYKNS